MPVASEPVMSDERSPGFSRRGFPNADSSHSSFSYVMPRASASASVIPIFSKSSLSLMARHPLLPTHHQRTEPLHAAGESLALDRIEFHVQDLVAVVLHGADDCVDLPGDLFSHSNVWFRNFEKLFSITTCTLPFLGARLARVASRYRSMPSFRYRYALFRAFLHVSRRSS